LRLSEWIALAYFFFLAATAGSAPVPASRRWQVIAAAAIVAFLILALARHPAGAVTLIVRDWIPLLYLVAGYWSPALLVRAPDERLEGTLLDFDRRWLHRIGFRNVTLRTVGRTFKPGESLPAEARGMWTGGWRRLFVELGELSYLFCYPLVPLGFSCLYLAGLRAEADRFWTVVFLAVFPCYGALPWLPTRPPRVVDGAPAGYSTIRTLNLRILERASVKLNTFPSGHVASAVATALAVATVLPTAGLLLIVIAGGVAAGSIVGRYHYLTDVIAGTAIALTAFWISRAIW
jgi:membrane-associated phospholipid phosphatase